MAQIQEIYSWATYGRVSGNRISLELPKELDAQEVQIIIIPQKKADYADKEGWKKDFMSISQWDIAEDDVGMKSWQIIDAFLLKART
jgi:hypothetical protein